MLGLLAVSSGAADLFDPTRPPQVRTSTAAVPVAAEPLAVRSILVSDERRIAVINGQRVRCGDKVGDAVVVSISPTAVQLRGPEGTITLDLYSGIKRRSARERE